jgi:hypothetical protein
MRISKCWSSANPWPTRPAGWGGSTGSFSQTKKLVDVFTELSSSGVVMGHTDMLKVVKQSVANWVVNVMLNNVVLYGCSIFWPHIYGIDQPDFLRHASRTVRQLESCLLCMNVGQRNIDTQSQWFPQMVDIPNSMVCICLYTLICRVVNNEP